MRTWGVCLGLALLATGACRQEPETETPVARPAFKPSKARVALGSPLELTYRFTVAEDLQPIDGNYRVFVHFLDSDRELMWTDDHEPAKATTEWQPGDVIEYSRTMFVPNYPYIGQATVLMGLYDVEAGTRLPLSGDDNGQRGYRVGSLELLPQSENVFLFFKEGWHPSESSPDDVAVEWWWTQKVATISLRNPKQDVAFYLDFDGRPELVPGQTVTVKVGETAIETFPVPKGEPTIHRVPIAAAQLGESEHVEIVLDINRTFVPAKLPDGDSEDPRELGIRVFHASVEPS
ncbi:MAG: hypothetical protein GEU99_09520 [Luteitalea sp.]|nr:hypothetical protein [Luteitalea sp.]